MGVSYSAKIIVGLHRSDLEDHENFEDFNDGDLDQAPPYYDGYEDAVYGISVASTDDYSASEIQYSLDEAIQRAKNDFKEKTGLDGKVWLTPVGY